MSSSVLAWPLLLVGLLACASTAGAQAVTLDVTLRLTDLDCRPLPGIAGRLAFGSDKDWQQPTSGVRFVTTAEGTAQVTARVTLDRRMRKYPSSFVAELLSSPQPTDHLTVAAELTYLEKPWRYVVELYRFPNGDTLQDDFRIYTADAHGAFALPATRVGTDWVMPELHGMVLTTPGYETWDHALSPDASDPTGRRWTLKLAFKRFPPPIRR